MVGVDASYAFHGPALQRHGTAGNSGLHDGPASGSGIHDKPASGFGIHDKPASGFGIHDKPASGFGIHDGPASGSHGPASGHAQDRISQRSKPLSGVALAGLLARLLKRMPGTCLSGPEAGLSGGGEAGGELFRSPRYHPALYRCRARRGCSDVCLKIARAKARISP